jgi:hypothetical protein
VIYVWLTSRTQPDLKRHANMSDSAHVSYFRT